MRFSVSNTAKCELGYDFGRVRVRVERLVWIDIYTLKSMGLYTGEKRSLQRRGFGVVLGRGIS